MYTKPQMTKLVWSVCEKLDCLAGPNSVVSDHLVVLSSFGFGLHLLRGLPCCRIRTYGSRYLAGVVHFANPSIPGNFEVMCYLVNIVSTRDQM